jgi:F-box protein 42
MNINWRTITPIDMAPSITKRFSHAACIHDNSMYIFGGCTTNSTAFNDLWRFDLSKRPLAMGTYPTPKAYATMIPYNDCLVLFGGWAYPLSIPISQDWMMSSEIHFYNTTSNRWILVFSINNPPPMAGHSAIISGDTMIVFGGLYKPSASPTRSSNDVWVLDLKSMTWTNKTTSLPKPPPRYGQSLIKLNNNHIMILGGIRASKVYDDCWILRMEGDVWTWFEITVKNKEWAITDLWCNPACRVCFISSVFI